MAKRIKITLHLPDPVRRRLGAIASRRNTTVSALLVEGANLVLERYERVAMELVSRAAEARNRLREGLYCGIPIAAKTDDLVYTLAKKGRDGARSSKRR